MTETIELTPTWSGILPILLVTHEEGDRVLARAELDRMAAVADEALRLTNILKKMETCINEQLDGVPLAASHHYLMTSFSNKQLEIILAFIKSFE